MQHLLKPRWVFFGLALLAVVAMLFAAWLEHGVGLNPCPLCITQRVFVVAGGLVALLAALHGAGALGRRIYAGLGVLLAIGGGGGGPPPPRLAAKPARRSGPGLRSQSRVHAGDPALPGNPEHGDDG